MRHVHWATGMALALVVIGAAAHAGLTEEEIDALAAEAEADLQAKHFQFSFEDLDGNLVTDKDERFRGKVLLVDLWGTWCRPCRREAPFLADLDRRYRDDGLEIVSIAFEWGEDKDKSLARIEKFRAEAGSTYTALYGGTTDEAETLFPHSVARLGYPTVIIFDRSGAVRKVEAGFWDKSADTIETVVKALLEEPREAAL